MTCTRRTCAWAILGLFLLGLAGCNGPNAVEGNVKVTSTNALGQPKANKPKPAHKPP